MLNNNTPEFHYRYSKSKPDVNFCETNPINSIIINPSHCPGLSWKNICSKININQEFIFDNISPIETVQVLRKENKNVNTPHYSSIGSEIKSYNHEQSNISIKNWSRKFKSPTCGLRNSKISTLKLRSLISKENMSCLPTEVQQNLIQLMPECDKILNECEKADNNIFTLSSTSLNNEFFNKALSNFFLKFTNKKPMISIESFINNIKLKKTHSDLLMLRKSENYAFSDFITNKPISSSNQEFMTSNSKYDFIEGFNNIAKPQLSFRASYINNPFNDSEIRINSQKEDNTLSNYINKSAKFHTEVIAGFSDNSKKEFYEFPSKDNISRKSTFPIENLESSRSNKYKRRNSGSDIASTPHKRPTRSTAGQLPARLKSLSPQAVHHTNAQFSNLSIFNKTVAIRTKNKEKKKSKSNDFFRNTKNIINENKSNTLNCDMILFNLRNKLSKRLQQNCQKYFCDNFSNEKSILNASPDINSLNSKSPCSLSPGSDKLSFVNSPLSKSSQCLKPSKLKYSFYENQAQTSPQWSFSSEFTSQSSVESVLSQKNTRLDQEEMIGVDNLLEDMDSEEMPPPRRTLTVAAMREKMRAKKMAKEGKTKNFNKDFLIDFESMKMNKILDLTLKQSHASTMSTMMSMPPENPSDETDDENIPNEFDSFLIDDNEIGDYHVEIDDKILNYSDDLDDLLLTGGNESLLEIIMKDPEALEISGDNFGPINPENQNQSSIASHMTFNTDDSKGIFAVNEPNISNSQTFTSATCNIISSPLKTEEKLAVSDSSFIKVDNPDLISQTLTSVIQKVSHNIQNSKDVSNIKGSLPNAYLVDGNGLSDALKLIQSLNPGAKVTTQQFYLVNSGPQLILCQSPPTQAYSTRPVNSKSPIKSVTNTTQISSGNPSSIVTPVIKHISVNNNINCSVQTLSNSNVVPHVNSSNPTTQNPILSSTISVLPQFSAFNSKTQNIYSVNSNFSNKIITPVANLSCKLNNNIQHSTTISSTGSNVFQQSTLIGNAKPVSTNSNSNSLGIRLQLPQSFQHSHSLGILQSGQNPVIPTLLNQQLQFLSPQPNANISLITQPQPLSKLVLLCPNLNCQPVGSDLNSSMKNDPQQLILVSPQKEQSNPIPLATNQTFQVLNGTNLWQQINPSLGTLFGSTNTNNLVLMNPQTLNNQSFSFSYQPQSQIITANNLVIMSNNFSPSSQITNQKSNNHNLKTINSVPTTSLTIAVNTKGDDDNLINLIPHCSTANHNSNCSQNSSVELLSNSSSSANSKISLDEKSNCQLSKSYSENMTDSDQEKSVSSPQFQFFTSDLSISITNSESDSFLPAQLAEKHLTVDIDSLSPPNSIFQNKISKQSENCLSTNSKNDYSNTNIIQSPVTDYDHSDFEIPCVYSEKLQISQISLINDNNQKNMFDS